MSEEKLLPCPFCGTVPVFDNDWKYVVCANASCYTYGPDGQGVGREATIAAWNRRAAQPQESKAASSIGKSDDYLRGVAYGQEHPLAEAAPNLDAERRRLWCDAYASAMLDEFGYADHDGSGAEHRADEAVRHFDARFGAKAKTSSPEGDEALVRAERALLDSAAEIERLKGELERWKSCAMASGPEAVKELVDKVRRFTDERAEKAEARVAVLEKFISEKGWAVP